MAATGKTVTTLKCKVAMTTTPPAGDNAVFQPAASGDQFGPVNCRPFGGSGFGGGIIANAFTVPDSGDLVGKYTQYFKAGSVSGSFDLVPQESDFTSTNFASQAWVGTIKVKRGTAIYSGIKEKKIGTMTCTTPDSVHFTCTERVKLKTV
jgi:hypothetical protein